MKVEQDTNENNRKFYVTTSIYYINDRPHIGHIYEAIAADVLARYYRIYRGSNNVFFLTGTDENSQKTVEAAKKVNKDIIQFTNDMADIWQKTLKQLNISYNRFIRTTEADHIKAVQNIIQQIYNHGDIYKGIYEGLYCYQCESFYKEEELDDGKCPNHKIRPEKVKEENYFFNLKKYQDSILKYINDNPSFIKPESRRNEVIAFIKRGLEDISISREGQQWGIKLPFDNNQVVYVWFDALINYLTGISYPNSDYHNWWPADVHIIGKDIIKFHCIIWPAMLMSIGIELPKTIFAHGFLTINGHKISKSLGNVIDPLLISSKYGVDVLRYYILREFPFGADGDFNIKRFQQVYEADLANELGNLIQRVAIMVDKYQGGSFNKINQSAHDIKPYHEAIKELRFDKALEEIWLLVKGLNQYIDEEKPWKLAKTDANQLNDILTHTISDIFQIMTLLLPFMPDTVAKISNIYHGNKINLNGGIIFPKDINIK